MAGINNVTLTGRLTADPEKVTSPGGVTISRFTLAVDRAKQGEADFIRVTAFNKTAELIAQYLSKGDGAGVVGRIQTGHYENKDGQTVYTTDVIADRIAFLGKARKNTDIPDSFEQALDDIPF